MYGGGSRTLTLHELGGSLVVIGMSNHNLKHLHLIISIQAYGITNLHDMSSGANNALGSHLGLMVTLVKFSTHCKTLMKNENMKINLSNHFVNR